MKKYICTVCEYIYDPEQGDPESGIEPGTAFEDIPDDWTCPLCGVGKEERIIKRRMTGCINIYLVIFYFYGWKLFC